MSSKEELLSLVLSEKKSVPIYFASTHGVYDLRHGPVESFIVPPNTYIFEASSIGEATLTTIDEPLWNMFQNRNEFASYLNSSPSANDEAKKQIIKNLAYYKPGDTVFKRTLVLDHENQYDYAWGYYKFNPETTGIPFPESAEIKDNEPIVIPVEPTDPPLTAVMKSMREEHFPPMKSRLRGFERIDTGNNAQVINEVRRRDRYTGPAIFIFSSCASFWESSNEKKDALSILEIGRAQQLANLQFAEMGFISGHTSGEDDIPILLGSDIRNIKIRKTKGKSVVEAFSKTVGLPDNLKFTRVESEELKYLEKVGSENSRFVRTRFRPIQTPPGAASIFIKNNDTYSVAVSPSGKTWWTYKEIESAIDQGREIYIYINGEWIKVTQKAGIYTSSLRQVYKKKTFGSNWVTGGSKTKKLRKRVKKTRKIL